MPYNKMDVIALLVFLVVSVFSLRAVFATSDPVAFHDLAPMYRLDQLFRPYDFPWDYKSNLGSPSMLTGNAVYNLPIIGLSLAFGSVALAHKVFLVLLMAFTGFGFYAAFTYLLSSRVAGFVAGLYLMFNPFTLARWVYGHNTILLAYMILPCALLSFFKSIRARGRKFMVACGLLVALLIATSPHIAYLFILFILLYAVFDLALSKRTGIVKRITSKGVQIGLVLGVAFAAAFPIFYQIAMVNLPVYSVRAEEAVLVVSPMDVTTSTLPQIALVAFIVSAFLYLLRKRGVTKSSISSLIRAHRQQILFFTAFGLFGVFLVSLATEPLSPIYSWLFDNIPGFSMFREANKFLLLSVLSLAFFIGLVAEGFKRCMGKCSSIARNALPLLLISSIVLASSWQFLTGDIGGNIGTVKIPEGYKEFEDWLSGQKGDFKIAFFPPAVWATTYTWASRWFLDPVVALQVKPTVELKSEFDLTASASLTRWVYTALYSNRTSEWGKLLGILGVKYLILRLDADMPPDRGDLGAFSLANTLASWSDQGGLQIEKRFGSILVYRNPYQLPHIYQTKDLSLVVGDRRALISLGHIGFDFSQDPTVFLDDNIGSAKSLINDASYVFSQGDPYWSLLVSSLGENSVVKPWLYAPTSSNPADKWVRGDLVWYYFSGDLNVAPDGYIYTYGANTIAIPLNVEKSGDYQILAQVFDGLPGSQGVRFTIDNATDYVFTPTRSIEGSYVWLEVGRSNLDSKSVLHISGLGGPAAVSKVALIPENAINEAEQNVSKLLEGSAAHMTYLFDDYEWSYAPQALITEPTASNGRLIALSKSNAETSFHLFREDTYMLRLSFQSSDEDALFKVHVDNYVKDVRLGRGTDGFSTEVDIGPLELKGGYHNMTIEVEEGDPRLDMATLSNGVDMIQASSSSYADSEGPSYSMSSGSEYVISGVESNLVFLEGGSGYWRLCGQDGEITPITVFNYGSLFHLGGLKSQYTLRYLGLNYLEQGLLVTLVTAALVALGLELLGPKRFTMCEPVY
jgi:hypothetical protein